MLPCFGKRAESLMDLCADKTIYAASLGLPRMTSGPAARLIGHPVDVFADLTEGKNKGIDSPSWEFPLDTTTYVPLWEQVRSFAPTQHLNNNPYRQLYHLVNPARKGYTENEDNLIWKMQRLITF